MKQVFIIECYNVACPEDSPWVIPGVCFTTAEAAERYWFNEYGVVEGVEYEVIGLEVMGYKGRITF